jgi:hypothetical protein
MATVADLTAIPIADVRKTYPEITFMQFAARTGYGAYRYCIKWLENGAERSGMLYIIPQNGRIIADCPIHKEQT